MGGHIDCYLDIASLYSYIALIQILKTQDILKQHSVEIEIHPVLLGAINAGSERTNPQEGNKPPWTLPAKATHSAFDSRRALRAVGLRSVSPPGDLFEAGRTTLPLRALLRIKATHPRRVYLTALHVLFHAFWTLHRVPTTADVLGEVLSEAPRDFTFAGDSESGTGGSFFAAGGEEAGFRSSGERLFTAAEVAQILRAAAEPEAKDALRRTTDEALARGAFGAPWLWVTDRRTGEAEPFFGSDRWHFVYEFLGLPYRDVALLPPSSPKAESKESKL
ncbi:thioredoxin-like protein [Whalleya microplaca]|nr:thioredoxin-like protein [Whalleya microplaca]